jgi:lipopolysaccharide export system protein LptA
MRLESILKNMWLRPVKSTIVISFFLLLNGAVWWGAWHHQGQEGWGRDSNELLEQTPSQMEHLEYFHLDRGMPVLSLVADAMQSVGEERADFVKPRGLYAVGEKRSSLFYEADRAEYLQVRQRLELKGNVALSYEEANYLADQVVYYPPKDLMWGLGNVKLLQVFAKTGDTLNVTAQRMKAYPKKKWSTLTGNVVGEVTPRQKFKPRMDFRSQTLEAIGATSEMRLRKDVFFKRGDMQATSQNGDLFLENGNKRLKYFVLNDDVKLVEKLPPGPDGKPITRRAWSERLEGFGQDRIVLSGAPRVEQGKDVVKGYQITLREQMEFIEVEDAMSDLSTKQEKKKD